MTMGEKILNLRKARGWNQEELAERIGVTRQAVSRWESGSAKPDADKIIAVCDLFGVSADYLLRDDYAGEGSTAAQHTIPITALEEKVQTFTLKQWAALGAALIGGLVMLVLKIVYVFQNTDYGYYTDARSYSGFQAFIFVEELGFIWYPALIAFLGGLYYLLVIPVILKDKEKNGWPWERD